MTLVASLLVSLAAVYASTLLWLLVGFKRACRRRVELDDRAATPMVSVVVPARNEESNILVCLESIFANTYEPFEVIVVDDESEDATAAFAEQFRVEHGLGSRLRIVRVGKSDITTGHKKRALGLGIGESRGEIIVTTDADSLVQPTWIRSLISMFDEEVDFVSAPVAYSEGRSFLGRAMALEMLGLVAVGGGGIALGYPNMCNGANLAYRRDAYDRVGGFASIDHLSSGDDTLLMLKISEGRPESVSFCCSLEALVTTRPAEGLKALVNQRLRWASKGLRYQNRNVTALAVLVYTLHAGLLLAAITAVFLPELWGAVIAAAILKIGSEALLVSAACRQFGRTYLMRGFVPAQFLQIPYVTIVGLLGVIGGGFSWKGRELAQ